ncbi:UNVERIFIED_CONTAM: hypothetical protein FKN15_059295 [Acipenser sinensis]
MINTLRSGCFSPYGDALLEAMFVSAFCSACSSSANALRSMIPCLTPRVAKWVVRGAGVTEFKVHHSTGMPSKTPAEGVYAILTCVAEILQQRVSSLFLPVSQQGSSRGSLRYPYLCCRDTPAEGVFVILTCVAEILQQRVSSLFLPVLQQDSRRGSLFHTFQCCRNTPAGGSHF